MTKYFTIRLTKKSFLLWFLFISYISSSAQSAFICSWKTNNPGTSDSTSITIPTVPNGLYNYDIDWNNDGIYDEFGVTDSITHDFGAPGIYTIRITGDFPRIYFNNEGDKAKIIDISQWGDIQWQSMNSAFQGCENLNISATDAPDLSQVADFTAIFRSCTSFNSPLEHWDVSNAGSFYFALSDCPHFNQPLNNWDVSNATNMQRMFLGCEAFNQPLDQWDVSNVTSFGAMFQKCKNFNQPIGNWDVGNAIHISMMFLEASSFNQDIGNWDVSNAVQMHGMFSRATVFNQDIGNWDVSNIKRMDGLFQNASAFNQDIGDWDVSNVERMEWMFAGASSFNQDIGNWNVGKVTSMNWMFFYATSFNQDIGNWDVSNVGSMQNMFKGTNMLFNQDIGNWDVSNVKDMNSMFEHNLSFDQNLGNWDVRNVTSMNRMFNQAKLSTPNYDSLLIGWNALDLQDSVKFHGGYSIYCAGWAARANMIDSHGWQINDGGAEQDAPIVICKDITVNLDETGGAGITPIMLDNGSYDYCTDIIFNASQTTFDCSDIGVLLDTLTVLDMNGNSNSCVANITILDAPFNLTCPPDITVNANSINCQAQVFWTEPLENCSVSISSNHSSGDLFPLGTTTIAYTAIDDQSNVTNCSFDVTVINDLAVQIDDIINPNCLNSANGQVYMTVSGGSAPYVFDWNNDGTGDFDDQEDQNNLPAGMNYFTITDSYGCQINDSIELQPNNLTIIDCPANINLKADLENCSAKVMWNEPIEICSGIPLVSSYTSGDTFALGTTVVNYLGSNIFGDTAICQFEVTVYNDLTINVDSLKDPLCYDIPNGQVFISVDGGNAPYDFDWNSEEEIANASLQNQDSLSGGIYNILVTDNNGCSTEDSLELVQPAPIELSAIFESKALDYNTIDLTVTGGIPPYFFDWGDLWQSRRHSSA